MPVVCIEAVDTAVDHFVAVYFAAVPFCCSCVYLCIQVNFCKKHPACTLVCFRIREPGVTKLCLNVVELFYNIDEEFFSSDNRIRIKLFGIEFSNSVGFCSKGWISEKVHVIGVSKCPEEPCLGIVPLNICIGIPVCFPYKIICISYAEAQTLIKCR